MKHFSETVPVTGFSLVSVPTMRIQNDFSPFCFLFKPGGYFRFLSTVYDSTSSQNSPIIINNSQAAAEQL